MVGASWKCQYCLPSASPGLTTLLCSALLGPALLCSGIGISSSLSSCSAALLTLLTAQPPRRAQLLAGDTRLSVLQYSTPYARQTARQRLIPDFSAIEAPAGVCRCAATGSAFRMQGSIERPSTRIWWTGSPILASPISMTSSSPKYNTLPHLLPSWPLSLSRSSASHFISSSFHISQEDSDQLACSVP
jgi:hypothetical protein